MKQKDSELLKRKNYLLGVAYVIDIYNQYHPEKTGLSNRAILHQYINPVLFRPISERTLYNYLSIPVKRDLKRINAIETAQNIKRQA